MFEKLKTFFSGPQEPPVDYSVLGVDMHSHLVPGIDDGVQTVEESIQLIQKLLDMGFTKIYTTPHIMTEGFPNTPETILGGLEKVKEELRNRNMDVEIGAAAEYYLDEQFMNRIQNEQLLTFSDNYVLFELPAMNIPANFFEVVFEMKMKGYQPILAHVERYNYLYSKGMDYYQNLRERGIFLQVNIGSVTGVYSPSVMKMAKQLIDNDLVDFLASDMHNERHASYLEKGLEDKYLQKVLREKTYKNIAL